MNKSELVKVVSDYLRDNNVRKPVPAQKHSFYISDEYDNTKEFVIRETAKKMLYTKNDVEAIIDACIEVIKTSIQNGEPVSVHGFGTLGLNYRKPRKTRLVGTDVDVDVPGRYVPKFNFGNDLRTSAKIYEITRQKSININELISYDDDGSPNKKVEL